MLVLADIGYICMLLTCATAIYALVVAAFAFFNERPAYLESARRAGIAAWLLLTLSTGALLYAFLSNDFSIKYVASYSSRSQPTLFKISAMWAGQNGSILFWGWLVASFACTVLLRGWRTPAERKMLSIVLVVTMSTLAFFVGLNIFLANPFVKFDFNPTDGMGLDPLLRHTAMVYHPPTLYLGYVGFVIPFALTLAALIVRRVDANWLLTIRRWALLPWLFLSIGIILGMVWAYDVLGWGGYWAWDPVENAALLPWLTGTAFIHSLVAQKRRGMFKALNVVLIILTYLLAIFGTFATRTGLVDSVHAFARSDIGYPFLIFFGLALVGAVAVLLNRLDDLKSEHRLDAMLTREAAVLLTVLLFLTITFSVFVGSYFSLLSELLTGDKRTVGPPWFNQVAGPQMAVLVTLMGLCPLLAWRRTSRQRLGRGLFWPLGLSLTLVVVLFATVTQNPGALLGLWICAFVGVNILWEFVRGVLARRQPVENHLLVQGRQRYGGYLVHLGIVLMTLGVIGSTSFKQETQATLLPGQSVRLAGFDLTYKELQPRSFAEGSIIEAVIIVDKNGRRLGKLYPRIEFYTRKDARVSVVAKRSTLAQDVYVSFSDWSEQDNSATLKFYVNPLVAWLWIGGALLVVGTLLAAWPRRVARRVSLESD